MRENMIINNCHASESWHPEAPRKDWIPDNSVFRQKPVVFGKTGFWYDKVI